MIDDLHATGTEEKDAGPAIREKFKDWLFHELEKVNRYMDVETTTWIQELRAVVGGLHRGDYEAMSCARGEFF